MRLKHEYNNILKLHHEASKYLNDNSIPREVREKQIPQYLKIRDKLDTLLSEMTKQGIFYDEINILNGFKEAIGV